MGEAAGELDRAPGAALAEVEVAPGDEALEVPDRRVAGTAFTGQKPHLPQDCVKVATSKREMSPKPVWLPGFGLVGTGIVILTSCSKGRKRVGKSQFTHDLQTDWWREAALRIGIPRPGGSHARWR